MCLKILSTPCRRPNAANPNSTILVPLSLSSHRHLLLLVDTFPAFLLNIYTMAVEMRRGRPSNMCLAKRGWRPTSRDRAAICTETSGADVAQRIFSHRLRLPRATRASSIRYNHMVWWMLSAYRQGSAYILIRTVSCEKYVVTFSGLFSVLLLWFRSTEQLTIGRSDS